MTKKEFIKAKMEDYRPTPWQKGMKALSLAEKAAEKENVKAQYGFLHEFAVQTAIKKDKPVSPEVLKDYPDLAAKVIPKAKSSNPVKKPFDPIAELEKETAVQRWAEQGKMLDEAEARASELRAEAKAKGLGTKESLKGVSIGKLQKLLRESPKAEAGNPRVTKSFRVTVTQGIIKPRGGVGAPFERTFTVQAKTPQAAVRAVRDSGIRADKVEVTEDKPVIPKKLATCKVVKTHDDGDLTLKCKDAKYIVTTEGETFKQVKR